MPILNNGGPSVPDAFEPPLHEIIGDYGSGYFGDQDEAMTAGMFVGDGWLSNVQAFHPDRWFPDLSESGYCTWSGPHADGFVFYCDKVKVNGLVQGISGDSTTWTVDCRGNTTIEYVNVFQTNADVLLDGCTGVTSFGYYGCASRDYCPDFSPLVNCMAFQFGQNTGWTTPTTDAMLAELVAMNFGTKDSAALTVTGTFYTGETPVAPPSGYRADVTQTPSVDSVNGVSLDGMQMLAFNGVGLVNGCAIYYNGTLYLSFDGTNWILATSSGADTGVPYWWSATRYGVYVPGGTATAPVTLTRYGPIDAGVLAIEALNQDGMTLVN